MPRKAATRVQGSTEAKLGPLRRFAALVFVAMLFGPGARLAHAQALPSAQREIQLSAFAGLTGSETGLNRNLAITAGVDIGLRLRLPFSLYPSVEGRGTYPMDGGGQAIRQRSTLAGLRVARFYGRFAPYADLLAGRNQTNYDNGYVAAAGDRYYVQSVSTVLSPGVGVDVELPRGFALKLDAQLQYYDSPVSSTGHLYAKPVTAGVVYRFGFGRTPR